MIISINNLNDMRLLDLIVKSVRAEDRKIGLTSGCYDLPHKMHHFYLERCRRVLGEGGVLVVGLDSDHWCGWSKARIARRFTRATAPN